MLTGEQMFTTIKMLKKALDEKKLRIVPFVQDVDSLELTQGLPLL